MLIAMQCGANNKRARSGYDYNNKRKSVNCSFFHRIV